MIKNMRIMILELCDEWDWDWKIHIKSVVKYSKILAQKQNADEEICELSAWLHDIIKLRDGVRESHHIKGSEEAVKILEQYNYPKEKIQKIKHCIISHSSDENYPPRSTEAKILAS